MSTRRSRAFRRSPASAPEMGQVTCGTEFSEATAPLPCYRQRPMYIRWRRAGRICAAYATTVHKAQGSEYPAVVILLVTQHWSMLRRNLVYTAVTRGKRLVVVVGQPKALAIAVKGTQARRRWSKLGEWLGDESEAVRGATMRTVG